MPRMNVGVIDVGANTLRLLVAAAGDGGLETVHTERFQLGLGEHIEAGGSIPPVLLEAVGRTARKQARAARRLGCTRVEIVVTSPGRQANNADELVESLSRADAAVRVLSAEEEAAYAYHGALATVHDLPKSAAVCDVGGGSTQIVVGWRDDGPTWIRSLDVGSLRLTRRASFDDPPTAEGLDRARSLVEPMFIELEPPIPRVAYATGGSARAVAKLVGPSLGRDELGVALRIVGERPSRRLAKTFGVSPARAQTLAAGTLLLALAQRRLGVPLTVARGGLREGVALSLLADAALAA
jgi:exopolyphosphatase / guanosine-5'-triphosphate,3'-diphosphate pyrophosphatase